MAWQKGYSKAHPGKYAVVMDWETSGSDFGGDSSVSYQGIAFGVVICDTEKWEEVDSLYREVYFDTAKYRWSEDAEKIHGLTQSHLATHGMSREDALGDLIELFLKYFAPGSKILMVGHNVWFDNDFTTQLFRDHGLLDVLKIHHVNVDTSGLAFALIGEYKSDVVFELLGGIDKRGCHNALDDARACLASLRNVKQIFQIGLS